MDLCKWNFYSIAVFIFVFKGSFAMGDDDNISNVTQGITMTEVAFFIVLALDMIAVSVLVWAVYWKRKPSTSISYTALHSRDNGIKQDESYMKASAYV